MLDKILPRNEHPIERILRVVIGLVLLSLTAVKALRWLGREAERR